MIKALILSVALAQAGAAGSELNQGDVAPSADAGAPEAKKPGPDVSKMPFTPYSIQEIVKYHLPDIQKCYEGVVLDIGGKNPPEGRVQVDFTILPNGLTTRTKVDRKKTTIRNDRIQDCVTDSVRTWEFPKPSDNREHPIEYPFDLKVQHEPGETPAKAEASTSDKGSTEATAKTSSKSKKKHKKK